MELENGKIINVENVIIEENLNRGFKLFHLGEEEQLEYIKANTNYLNNIDLNNVKQIEPDYYNNVYILLNDGKLYKNAEYQDSNIEKLYAFDTINIYKITTTNQIIPVATNKDSWSELGLYCNNNAEEYKKILTDPLFLIALKNDGKVISIMNCPPTGVGIVPENFVDVEDVMFDKISTDSDIVVPYVMKNKQKIPLYIMD